MANSIDDVVNDESAQEIAPQKSYSRLHQQLLAAALATALAVSGAVAPTRAYSDGMPDASKTTGTEQVSQQQIDLSKYTKVAEQDGLDFYISKETSAKPIHDLNKKTNPDWHTTQTRFYDCVIVNNTDLLYTVLELSGKAKDRPGPVNAIPGDILKKIWGTITIPPRGYLIEQDRYAWTKKGAFPLEASDVYKLRDNTENIKTVDITYIVK
jgi:hypothetical protein